MFGAPTRIQSSVWKALPVLSITFGVLSLGEYSSARNEKGGPSDGRTRTEATAAGATLTVNADGSAVSNCSVSVRADFDWFGASPAGSVPIVAMRKSLS